MPISYSIPVIFAFLTAISVNSSTVPEFLLASFLALMSDLICPWLDHIVLTIEIHLCRLIVSLKSLHGSFVDIQISEELLTVLSKCMCCSGHPPLPGLAKSSNQSSWFSCFSLAISAA
jgi:hypothetical protein